jgi:hypothetical protein
MKLFTKVLLSAFLVVCFSQSHGQGSTRLRAMPDTFTVLQAMVDTFAVTTVDSIPAGDSVCISLVGSPVGFSVLNCHSIIFRPDSTFTGRDTCRYALCDTAGICDTAMVVVYVDTNYALLLPVAGFVQDSIVGFSNPYYSNPYAEFFTCHHYTWGIGPPACWAYAFSNNSVRYDSVSWSVRDTCVYCPYPNYHYFGNIDTLSLGPLWNLNFYGGNVLQVCITAYNKFGSVTYCDTSCRIDICEGIAEVPLANIHIYPDPADRVLTIDMRQNTDPISASYAAIHIYDKLGQRVRSIPRHDSSRLVEISVASLPDGIYLSTITGAGGTEMMLGRFTVVK